MAIVPKRLSGASRARQTLGCIKREGTALQTMGRHLSATTSHKTKKSRERRKTRRGTAFQGVYPVQTHTQNYLTHTYGRSHFCSSIVSLVCTHATQKETRRKNKPDAAETYRRRARNGTAGITSRTKRRTGTPCPISCNEGQCGSAELGSRQRYPCGSRCS